MPRTFWLAAVIAIAAAVPCRTARAQADPTMPADTAAIFVDIDDLDKLRLLNPLELKAQQLEKIIPFIKTRQKAYNQRITDLAVTPLKAVAVEIAETREKLLAGGAIPQTLDDRIKRLQKEFADQRKIEQDKNLKLVADGIRSVLTDKQHKDIVAMARRDFRSADGTDQQFYNLWIRETVIAYDRIVPLLEDMLKARGKPGAPGA
ncbi:MAG: hypothetical protein FJX72_01235 [Armatimonadetes bacterium]|nr:hypothetical protein [Armatimonadota bacterium]